MLFRSRLLARLVGGHRRKLNLEGIDQLLPPWDRRGVYLIVLLRIAALLQRSRSEANLPAITLVAKGQSLDLRLPARWLREHPLTGADLSQEIENLRAAGFRLRVYSG